MQEYSEKREFPRMLMGCAIRYQVEETGDSSIGILKDLSGGGINLWIDKHLPAGTNLLVEIRPVKAITPPMRAKVTVERCDQLPTEENGEFSIACSIVEMMERDEIKAQQ